MQGVWIVAGAVLGAVLAPWLVPALLRGTLGAVKAVTYSGPALRREARARRRRANERGIL